MAWNYVDRLTVFAADRFFYDLNDALGTAGSSPMDDIMVLILAALSTMTGGAERL